MTSCRSTDQTCFTCFVFSCPTRCTRIPIPRDTRADTVRSCIFITDHTVYNPRRYWTSALFSEAAEDASTTLTEASLLPNCCCKHPFLQRPIPSLMRPCTLTQRNFRYAQPGLLHQPMQSFFGPVSQVRCLVMVHSSVTAPRLGESMCMRRVL